MGFISGAIKNFIFGIFFMLGLMVGGYAIYRVAMHLILG